MATQEHPRHTLDEAIQSPVRFSILACLSGVGEAEFGYVRDAVEISDSTLSKQVSLLSESGFVHVRKGYVGKRPRTWLSLTAAGRERFNRHLATLQEIARRSAAISG